MGTTTTFAAAFVPLVLTLLLPPHGVAAVSEHETTSGPPFDVVRYGADPSGANDSTAAIQRAIYAAGNASVGHGQLLAYAVEFPAGTYRVNGTLHIGAPHRNSNVRLRGVHGSAVINQGCADCDIFYGDSVWRLEVSGLALVGGANQIHARQDYAEHCCWLSALHCTATVRILIPVQWYPA